MVGCLKMLEWRNSSTPAPTRSMIRHYGTTTKDCMQNTRLSLQLCGGDGKTSSFTPHIFCNPTGSHSTFDAFLRLPIRHAIHIFGPRYICGGGGKRSSFGRGRSANKWQGYCRRALLFGKEEAAPIIVSADTVETL